MIRDWMLKMVAQPMKNDFKAYAMIHYDAEALREGNNAEQSYIISINPMDVNEQTILANEMVKHGIGYEELLRGISEYVDSTGLKGFYNLEKRHHKQVPTIRIKLDEEGLVLAKVMNINLDGRIFEIEGKTSDSLLESLEYGELKGLVDGKILIDMHNPKINDEVDVVVVAFSVKYEDPANDLSSFIETSSIEHLDVEVSAGPDHDGTWKVFVEFYRDLNLFEKIEALLHEIDQVLEREDNLWHYRALGTKKFFKFNKENFKRDVLTSRYEYRKKHIMNEPEDG